MAVRWRRRKLRSDKKCWRAPLRKKRKKVKTGKWKKRKAKADGAAEAELSSMLAVADQVAEQQNVNVDKVVGKEEAKLAYVAIPTMQASHCRASLHQVYPLLCTCTAAGSPVSAAVTHTVLLRA